MFRAHVLIVRRARIVLYSLWYHHTYRWPSGAQIERGKKSISCVKSRECLYEYMQKHGAYAEVISI